MKKESRKKRFWRRLYRLYKSNSSASEGFGHRITVFGYLVITFFSIALTLRLSSASNSLFGLVSFLAATCIFSIILVLFRKASVEVKRELPSVGTVGEKLSYDVVIKNNSMFKLTSTRLVELVQTVIPSEEVFINSVEPGEEKRNAFDRLFVVYRWKWLTEMREEFSSKVSAPIEIKGKAEERVTMSILPKRRGYIKLSNMRLLLPDPFFLFQKCKKIPQSSSQVLILPSMYSVLPIVADGNMQSYKSGDIASHLIGQSSEFVGLREYRAGDQIRNLDWKSWAKTGEPYVREYEDTFESKLGVFIDTAVAPSHYQEFEESISLAASFVSADQYQNGIVEHLFIQNQEGVKALSRTLDKVEKMQQILACADMEVDADTKELLASIGKRSKDLNTLIMLFCKWDEEKRELVNKIEALGISPVCFLINSNREIAEKSLSSHSIGIPPYLLNIGEIQNDLDNIF